MESLPERFISAVLLEGKGVITGAVRGRNKGSTYTSLPLCVEGLFPESVHETCFVLCGGCGLVVTLPEGAVPAVTLPEGILELCGGGIALPESIVKLRGMLSPACYHVKKGID